MTDAVPPPETPGRSAPRDALARRVRDLLAAHPEVREVNMFGGLSFMVDERLAVSAGRDGDLLVRADPADYDRLVERGAAQARMRNGREMGRSWLRVAAVRIDDDAELARGGRHGGRPQVLTRPDRHAASRTARGCAGSTRVHFYPRSERETGHDCTLAAGVSAAAAPAAGPRRAAR